MNLKKTLMLEEPLGLLRCTSFAAGALSNFIQPKYRIFTRIMLGYYYLSSSLLLCGCMITVLETDHFLKEGILEGVNFFINGMTSIYMLHLLQYPSSRFTKILQDIIDLWNSLKNDHCALKKYQKNANNASITAVIITPITVTMATTISFFGNILKGKSDLPYKFWVPQIFHDYLIIGGLTQLWVIYFYTLGLVVYATSFIYILTIHIYGISVVLSHEMSNLSKLERQKRIFVYKCHQKLIEILHSLCIEFKYAWSFQVVFLPASFIFPLYTLAKDLRSIEENLNALVTHLMVVFTNFGFMYIGFGAGALVSKASDKILQGFQQNDWYLDGKNEVKEIKIIGEMLKRGMSYEYRGVFKLDRNSTSKVLQAVYSYFGLLLNME